MASPPTPYASRIDVNEGLPLYWDPRYEEEFYQGLMPPPTGEEYLHSLYAAPMVELHPADVPDVAPIFVPVDPAGLRSRPSTGKRIRWKLRQRPKKGENWDIPCSVACLSFSAVVLCTITLLVFFMLWTSMDDGGGSQESSWAEVTDEIGFGLNPFKVPEMITHSNNTRTLPPQL
ncbi:hypothetical protein V5799_022491 [Amblyomma americanum]|uniref:Uncharacterized protein n=1 Tax=Amblyomma americanum TaxID=6943 RepID=A0AAQ4FMN7_AMBAM